MREAEENSKNVKVGHVTQGAGKDLSGPVEVSPPPGATREQIEQVKAYVDGSNKVKKGHYHLQGEYQLKEI